MGILIVQLSDLHAKTQSDPIHKRLDAIKCAVVSEMDEQVEACILLFCGDATQAATVEQFNNAEKLLRQLQSEILRERPTIRVHILTVPGNHDCDLTSHDQDARNALRPMVKRESPSQSILDILAKDQNNYYAFAGKVGEVTAAFNSEFPFYRHFDIILGSKRRVRFHLINSALTSTINETDDLRYPLDAFKPPSEPEADYGIAIMHHPIHWFWREVRREFREIIEKYSDLVLTGHEHEHESSRRSVHDGPELEYIEGGVLQDFDNLEHCTFNMIRIDCDANQRQIKNFSWKGNHFDIIGGPKDGEICRNSARADRRFRLVPSFNGWLDDLEDPITHPRENKLRLSHLFAYPDLRTFIEVQTEKNPGAGTQVAQRVRSDSVYADIILHHHVLIVGSDKSGKTSLAKRLYHDLHKEGKLPILLKGSEIGRSGSTEGLRRSVERAVRSQYELVTAAQYEQLNISNKVLILDDLHEGPVDPKARRQLFQYIDKNFGMVILLSSDDYYLEVVNEHASYNSDLLQYKRYDICDFGHIRLEELAEKWLKIGRNDVDPSDLKVDVHNLCEKVEAILAVAGLPHTPWLLIVMLEQAESADAPAAKNGSYGHLYQAVITVALSRSRLKYPDISGKYTYLSEFAYHLHRLRRPSLNEKESREFHKAHCEKYDLPFDFEKLRDDIIDIRMLRLDGDQLAFRHKYTYCFFVAWWLSRNIHKDEAKYVVQELSGRLHHDISANILVFLSHLSDDPVVLTEMKTAANRLFQQGKAAVIDNDIKSLNALIGVESFFSLPSTSPEMNLKLMREREDESRVKIGPENSHDGRTVCAIPEENEPSGYEELHRELNEIRAAIRTIGILGQVLRNGASSIPADEKLSIMREVLLVGRRLLGFLYSHLEQIDVLLKEVSDRYLAVQHQLRQEEAVQNGETVKDLDASQLANLEKEARLFANRLWFDLYWLATFAVIKRMSSAIGMKLLDTTMAKVKAADKCLPNCLVDLSMRMNRRDKHIPADEIVAIHEELKQHKNSLGRIVMEALACERLTLFDTHYADVQKICTQMGIRVPKASYDSSRKMFVNSPHNATPQASSLLLPLNKEQPSSSQGS